MKAIVGTVCTAANKIHLNMEYVESVDDRIKTAQMALDAIQVSQTLLGVLDPLELREGLTTCEVVFLKRANELTRDSELWNSYVGRTGDRLHELKLHQRSIQVLAGILQEWNCTPQTFSVFADSLDTLDNLATSDSESLAATLLQRNNEGFDNADLFGLMHNSLALLVSSIANMADNDQLDHAVNAIFGMTLFTQCCHQLLQSHRPQASETE